MTYASRLAGLEQQKGTHWEQQQDAMNNPKQSVTTNTNTKEDGDDEDFDSNTNRPWPSLLDSYTPNQNQNINANANEDKVTDRKYSRYGAEEDDTKAVDIYSELMSTLIATTKTTQKSLPLPRGREPPRSKDSPDATVEAASNELFQVTMVFREMKASGVVPDLGSYHTLLRSCANSGDIDRAQEILKEIQDPAVDLEPNDRTWRAILRAAGKAKRSDMVLKTWNAAVADMGDNSSEHDQKVGSVAETRRVSSTSVTSMNATTLKRKKRKNNSLSVHTFRTLLTALLVCAWDLRKSDLHASVQIYKMIIKCYNALRSSSSSNVTERSSSSTSVAETKTASSKMKSSYMGMHLLDSNAAMQNPQIMASILQAVVNLEYLLDKDDEWKEKLKRLGVSIAKTSCLGEESLQSSSDKQLAKSVTTPSLSFFDKRALNTVRSWY